MRMKYVIKWENKYSHETGYVGSFTKKDGHFVSTTEKENAKTYANKAIASRTVSSLTEVGEAENNIFTIETV